MTTTYEAIPASSSAPIYVQSRFNIPLPTYDWNVSDKIYEIHLFSQQLQILIKLHNIRETGRLLYVLMIIGKEGYVAMEHW